MVGEMEVVGIFKRVATLECLYVELEKPQQGLSRQAKTKCK